MTARPAEYFLSISDFFAVLVPGGLLAAWFAPAVTTQVLGPLGLTPYLHAPFAQWGLLLLGAYVLGHVSYSVGATLDGLVDPFYTRQRTEDWESRMGLDPPVAPGKRRVVAGAWLRMNRPDTTADLERIMAVSKLFRSLAVVLPVMLLAGPQARPGGEIQFAWFPVLEVSRPAAVCLGVFWLYSIGAYAHHRRFHHESVIRYYLLANAQGAAAVPPE